MRYILPLILVFWANLLIAQDWEDRQLFGPSGAERTLRVLSSTDTALLAPLLQSFVDQSPGTAVDYIVAATADIDRHVRSALDDFDVVISSAMDLQFKLANDGYARRLEGLVHPGWAQWRQSLFAFTSEPAAIVINRAAFAGLSMPRTRQDLIRVLRDNPERFKGLVGTYDVRVSGLGYLFATQDARTSETYWRLMEVMGNLKTRLYCCSGEMIEDVAAGEIAVAYNVLGSYAAARADFAEDIEIILPQDFQTIMMRSALVPERTRQPELAEAFVVHLLDQGAEGAQKSMQLPFLNIRSEPQAQSTIQLEPALLTYLDRLKAQRFLSEWSEAVIQ